MSGYFGSGRSKVKVSNDGKFAVWTNESSSLVHIAPASGGATVTLDLPYDNPDVHISKLGGALVLSDPGGSDMFYYSSEFDGTENSISTYSFSDNLIEGGSGVTADGNVIYVMTAGNNYVLHKLVKGGTWQSVWSYLASPDVRHLVVGPSEGHVMFTHEFSSIWKSTPENETIFLAIPIQLPLDPETPYVVPVAFRDENSWIIKNTQNGTLWGYYITTDGGATPYSALRNGLEDNFDIAFTPDFSKMVAVYVPGYAYRSLDGGQNFSNIPDSYIGTGTRPYISII